MNCPDCKQESMAALCKTGDARQTAIFIATAVLEVGVDIPELPCVVLFPQPQSSCSLVQRAGRPARELGARGEAIVYIKKADLEAARKLAESTPRDEHLLVPDGNIEQATAVQEGENASVFVRDREADMIPNAVVSREIGRSADETRIEEDETSPPLPDTLPGLSIPAQVGKSKGGLKKTKSAETTVLPHPAPGKRSCASLPLILAAHARQLCITRQINMIYGNPGVNRNCGQCSSCVVHAIPDLRQLASLEPPPIPRIILQS
jgi:superfamily II DNA/RNA helicase